VTSDHGEGLGEHGEATHGPFLYQTTLHVPLVVAAPGRWPAGRRVKGLVSIVDLVPTLLTLAGRPTPPALDGRDIGPSTRGEAGTERRLPLETEFALDSYGWAPLVGLTDGALKWIGAPEEELYDLTADPGELSNLAGRRPEDMRRLAGLWKKAVTQDRRSLPVAGSETEDAERLARLQSLGYVAGSRAGADDRKGLPDPKKVIGSLELINEARQLIGERRYDEAIERLERARRDSPRNLSALVLTGVAQLQAGRPQAALAPLRRAPRLLRQCRRALQRRPRPGPQRRRARRQACHLLALSPQYRRRGQPRRSAAGRPGRRGPGTLNHSPGGPLKPAPRLLEESWPSFTFPGAPPAADASLGRAAAAPAARRHECWARR
jgi:tetratricopeptide (TPR) repeat protein